MRELDMQYISLYYYSHSHLKPYSLFTEHSYRTYSSVGILLAFLIFVAETLIAKIHLRF